MLEKVEIISKFCDATRNYCFLFRVCRTHMRFGCTQSSVSTHSPSISNLSVEFICDNSWSENWTHFQVFDFLFTNIAVTTFWTQSTIPMLVFLARGWRNIIASSVFSFWEKFLPHIWSDFQNKWNNFQKFTENEAKNALSKKIAKKSSPAR